jgi:hypothetical protein
LSSNSLEHAGETSLAEQLNKLDPNPTTRYIAYGFLPAVSKPIL